MAGSGLLALLDDIATIADDVATLTVAATKKTTGIVTDDMAVTAEQTIGLARERELPVVWQVAKGSLFNKALILAPAALLLAAVAPWAIRPVLMAGGAFLCFEGVEKIVHKVRGHHDDHHADYGPVDPVAFERGRVRGAIRTDLILSGEIIAITLGEITEAAFTTQVVVLYGVSLIMTVGVYGLVAGLIKVDDLGAAMVAAGGSRAPAGRAILRGAPYMFHAISWIGTVAMLMVGGHILLEGIPPLEHFVHDLLHDLHGPLATVAGIAADVAVGALFGAPLAALVATGLPGRAWALVAGRGRREGPPAA